MARERLDDHLVRTGVATSREHAAKLIMAGEIRIGESKAEKAAQPMPPGVIAGFFPRTPHVGRGFHKLAGALTTLEVDASGKVCADVGSSTGGFTEVLLERGASRVYAIDVGYGELAWKLRSDPRVVVMERTNARHVEQLAEPVGLISIDVSFISLTVILPVVRKWLTPEGEIVALLKPQFEAAKEDVPVGGIIVDPAVHRNILERMSAWCAAHGMGLQTHIQSSLPGAGGNIEFFLHLRPIRPTA